MEGLSISEAWNDLGFISVGQYQKPLPPQSGAPIRLTVSWIGGALRVITMLYFFL